MRGAPLTVLVCSIAREEIPGTLRFAWMREMFPDVDVRHCTDENPQEPSEHPDFWSIWRRSIERYCPRPSHVFASEPYGAQLARELGAEFVPVDIGREIVPISGTAIRSNPLEHWHYLPEPVRPYFVKRVAILGPESSGKTTFARHLAARYETAWAHEWARPYYEWKPPPFELSDMPLIARGQDAAIHAAERRARRILFTDTDAVTTCVWSEMLFGQVPHEVASIAAAQRIDLSLVLAPDTPWVDDGQRVQPDIEVRRDFVARLCERLRAHGREPVLLRGTWEEKEGRPWKRSRRS